MAKRKRPSAARRQAKTEANIRFGPEKRALADLLYQAQADLHTGLRQERGAAAGVQAAISAAAPELAGHYAEATGGLNTANAMLQKDMSTLGASADPYKAVAANEAAAARRRLGSAMARAQTDLSQQKIRAVEGRVFGERQQRAEYGQKVDKYAQSLRGLKASAGEFEVGALRDILEANRKADLENRKLGETRRSHRATERNTRAGHQVSREGQAITRQGQVETDRREREKAAGGGAGKPKFTTVQVRDARAKFRKGLLLTQRAKPKRSEGQDFVAFLTNKDIPEPIARAAVQTYLFGGVRRKQRRAVQRNYGLKPKVMPRKSRLPRVPLPGF